MAACPRRTDRSLPPAAVGVELCRAVGGACCRCPVRTTHSQPRTRKDHCNARSCRSAGQAPRSLQRRRLTTPPPSGGFFMRSSARPLQPVFIGRERFIERRPGAREIFRHRGPRPQRATQQPCLQLSTLLRGQQVMNRIEHHGIRPGQPIRPPAAAILPPATTRGQGRCQAVEHPQPPPNRKPPAVTSPDLLPIKGLVSSNLPGLNRHGARRHGKQGRCHCIPARRWWALRGGVWGLWCGPGGGGLAASGWGFSAVKVHQAG